MASLEFTCFMGKLEQLLELFWDFSFLSSQVLNALKSLKNEYLLYDIDSFPCLRISLFDTLYPQKNMSTYYTKILMQMKWRF